MILREFCANTGYHRKYAIRLLNGPPPEKRRTRYERRRGLSYNTSYGYILRWLDTDAEARCPYSGQLSSPGATLAAWRAIAVFSEAAGTVRWAPVTGIAFLFLDAAVQFVVKLFV